MTEKKPAKPAARQRGTGTIRVYTSLRESILTLKLRPGELLDEKKLSEKFELSRSPIREALVRLSSEGLIQTLPNKSAIVAPLEVETFGQYIDALDIVQRITTRLAAKLHTATELKSIYARQKQFEKALAKHDALAMIETNREFHVAISEAGHNQYLSDFNARLLDKGRRFSRLYYQSFDDYLPTRFNEEHNRIIDAIEARNVEKAEELAKQHCRQIGERFIEYLSTRHTENYSFTE